MCNKEQSPFSKLAEELTAEPRFQVDNKYIGDQLSFEQKIDYLLTGPLEIAATKERLLRLSEYLLLGDDPGDAFDLKFCALALTRVILLLDFLHQHSIRKELAEYIKDPDRYATPYERWLQLADQK